MRKAIRNVYTLLFALILNAFVSVGLNIKEKFPLRLKQLQKLILQGISNEIPRISITGRLMYILKFSKAATIVFETDHHTFYLPSR